MMDQTGWQTANLENVGTDNNETKSIPERQEKEKVKLIKRTTIVI